MENPARQLSSTDLDELQEALRLKLPEDYRSFLLKHNGGIPSPYAFPIQGLKNNPFGLLQVFFGIGRQSRASNLAWNVETFKGRLPANLLPIARTGTGDLVCLSLEGADKGSVVFWDAMNEPAEPNYSNVYLVAKSFTLFLRSVYDDSVGNEK